MASQNGTEYAQNYDVILKWMAAALQGETLEVLGVKSGRIQEVFGFEPVDIAVKAERVDVIVRDEASAFYHIEEQRNLRKADLYRFASYHFAGAKQWGDQLTDIILASGDVYSGEKVITTNSGTYAPIVVDFSERDGHRRLTEIREAIRTGTFAQWLELVLLPLYGKDTGTRRSEWVEEVLRFESELYHAKKLSPRLIAATLILSNKLIDKDRLNRIWEEIKMLDILEIAEEKGIEKGKTLGELSAMREMVVEALIDRFEVVSIRLSEQIRTLHNQDVLKVLFHQALKCQNLQEFEAVLKQVQEC